MLCKYKKLIWNFTYTFQSAEQAVISLIFYIIVKFCQHGITSIFIKKYNIFICAQAICSKLGNKNVSIFCLVLQQNILVILVSLEA